MWFQILVERSVPELVSEMGFQEKKVQMLQETLLRVLDRKEEERQSKQLLELYLQAVEREDGKQTEPSQDGNNYYIHSKSLSEVKQVFAVYRQL